MPPCSLVTRENTLTASTFGAAETAPQLQPIVTGHDTTEVHALPMRRAREEQKREGTTVNTAESLPELKPWREVGWIFRDGDCIAIERKGDETRARVLVD
jgi:hypothetical protein